LGRKVETGEVGKGESVEEDKRQVERKIVTV
jgi:hypothetical protein